MKCEQCGKRITKRQTFCPYCGVNIPQTPSKKSFPLTIVLSIVLVLSLTANVILLCMPKPSQVSNQGASGKLEGNGFSSPEAAITAYAEALRDGNLDRMLATFALESYVEAFDMETFIARIGSYSFNSFDVALPNNNDYQERINYYSRLATITKQIKNGYYTLAGVDLSKPVITFPRDNQSEEIQAFLQDIGDPDFERKLTYIKIGNVLTVDDFDVNSKYDEYLAKNYSYLDVEKLCDVAIEITFDGEQYYLFMLTAKIGGKWYNIVPGGMLSTMIGLDPNMGGIMKQ